MGGALLVLITLMYALLRSVHRTRSALAPASAAVGGRLAPADGAPSPSDPFETLRLQPGLAISPARSGRSGATPRVYAKARTG
jgi:hypothetical protein